MATNPRELFQKQQYINLETYRKTGEAVRTPVWFAQDGSTLYVWTMGSSGKAKRIRRTGSVKVTPSDARGEPKGDWVTGQAVVAPAGSPEYVKGNGLMNRKYGLVKRAFELMNRGNSTDRVIIKIELS